MPKENATKKGKICPKKIEKILTSDIMYYVSKRNYGGGTNE
jgi:hypothetical protein